MLSNDREISNCFIVYNPSQRLRFNFSYDLMLELEIIPINS